MVTLKPFRIVVDSCVASEEHFTVHLPTKRVAADCLIFDAAGRVLLLKPTYKTTWDLPGGVVEPDESPRAAARRELREEVGLDVEPGRLLAVDWVARDRGATEVMAFLFEAGVEEIDVDGLVLQPEEVSAATFATESELLSLLDGEAASRVATAISARGRGTAVYLENGQPVNPPEPRFLPTAAR